MAGQAVPKEEQNTPAPARGAGEPGGLGRAGWLEWARKGGGWRLPPAHCCHPATAVPFFYPAEQTRASSSGLHHQE